MIECHADDLLDMRVVQEIDRVAALLPKVHDPLGPKLAQMVGYGRLALAHRFADLADAQAAGEKAKQYFEPGAVRKGFEEIRGVKNIVVVFQTFPDPFDLTFVHGALFFAIIHRSSLATYKHMLMYLYYSGIYKLSIVIHVSL
jgi:hypothetical protein